MLTPEHRKTVKHFEEPGHCRELTFSCYRRLPLLTDERRLEQLSRAIDNALHNHHWKLTAFVFMPEHVHLLVFPNGNASPVSDLLFAIKRPFSYRVKQDLIATADPLLSELTIQQRPGVTTFRFWQEGAGYDRNLWSPDAMNASFDYLHTNPVKRKLCDLAGDWLWSSARWYETDGTLVDPRLPTLTRLPGNFFQIGTRGIIG